MAARALTLFALLFSCSTASAAGLDTRATATCTYALATPSPAPRFHCEEKGTISNPGSNVISTTRRNTLAICRNSCISNTACVSFAYATSRQCTLYKAKLNDMGFRASSTGPISANRGCYTCQCAAGLTKCSDTACLDLKNDAANCGSCGKQCPTGQVCLNGACGCPTGQTLCGDTCVDTKTSTGNCGACGNQCGTGAACSAGSCACPSNQGLCSGANGPCQDLLQSTTNCGSCGNQCGTGASCSAGSCTCPKDQALCTGKNGPCQDLLASNTNCGACGVSCGANEFCQGGQCLCQATTPLGGQKACKGSCQTDYNTDPDNCGSCGEQCLFLGQSCKTGSCACTDSNQEVCGTSCTNTQNDPCNCGECGQKCGSSQICSRGTCTTGTPTVILSNPTPLTNMANGISLANYDDEVFTVNLPFTLSLFGVNSTTVRVSVNGVLAIGTGTIGYGNSQLPSSNLPDTAIAALWSDLKINTGTPEGIFYQISGVAPRRSAAFEWFTNRQEDATGYYHFILEVFEDKPSTAVFKYYQVADSGNAATVGLQRKSTGKVKQYSYNQANVKNGLVLAYDPGSNMFTARGGCS